MSKKSIVYKMITDMVIDGLKTEGLEWFKPWTSNGQVILPSSYTSQTTYKGLNMMLLSSHMRHRGIENPNFITYKQAAELGGTIKKGSTSVPVIWWVVSYCYKDKWYNDKKKLPVPSSNPDVFENWTPRYYRVFSILDTEGIEDMKWIKPKPSRKKFNPIKRAEKIYTKYPSKPALMLGGDRASYSPTTDVVNMPDGIQFKTSDDYYKTLFHELVHSTGHKNRLNRNIDNRYGNEKYSKEELVAEMGSMFLVGMTGISPQDSSLNSQAYINGWCSKLANEQEMVVQASSQAQRAIELLTKNIN